MERYFKIYILVVSLIMLTQVIAFNIFWQIGFNFYEWSRAHIESNIFLNNFLGGLFYFSMINILIVGLSGIWMLVRKNTGIGLIALIAAVSYIVYIFQIKNDF